jgi:hypothetical protein
MMFHARRMNIEGGTRGRERFHNKGDNDFGSRSDDNGCRPVAGFENRFLPHLNPTKDYLRSSGTRPHHPDVNTFHARVAQKSTRTVQKTIDYHAFFWKLERQALLPVRVWKDSTTTIAAAFPLVCVCIVLVFMRLVVDHYS